MDQYTPVLSRWLEKSAAATVHSVAGGFSSAAVWRVESDGEAYALKRWPLGAISVDRLTAINAFQGRLAAQMPVVPAPLPTADGATCFERDDFIWRLEFWKPGEANYWQDPNDAKLVAAMRALAELHLAAASQTPGASIMRAASPALADRDDRLQALTHGGISPLRQDASRAAGDDRPLAAAAYQLIEHLLPAVASLVSPWRRLELPLQWRIGDLWHDHVLFTGNHVTGIIDFGAASVDSPMSDVARLLGSLVADDPHRRQQGLAAYEHVRPLASGERPAIYVFDRSGSLLAAANWIHWLWGDTSPLTAAVRTAGAVRLKRLVERLGAVDAH